VNFSCSASSGKLLNTWSFWPLLAFRAVLLACATENLWTRSLSSIRMRSMPHGGDGKVEDASKDLLDSATSAFLPRFLKPPVPKTLLT
ncbi:hypothetical protein RB213_004611, partial [Colletotrichum asianum]